jgi:nucleoid-associated protein YgaU
MCSGICGHAKTDDGGKVFMQVFMQMTGLPIAGLEMTHSPVAPVQPKPRRLYAARPAATGTPLGRAGKRTRREDLRRTAKALLLLLTVALLLVVAPRVVETRTQEQAPAVTYTVVPGDTLWDIASHFYPGQDARKGVAAIKQANRLRTAALQPGQVLLIPPAPRR